MSPGTAEAASTCWCRGDPVAPAAAGRSAGPASEAAPAGPGTAEAAPGAARDPSRRRPRVTPTCPAPDLDRRGGRAPRHDDPDAALLRAARPGQAVEAVGTAQRRYGPDELDRLQQIRELQTLLGLDLDEIGEHLAAWDHLEELKAEYRSGPPPARRQAILAEGLPILESLRQRVEDRQEQLAVFASHLDERMRKYHAAMGSAEPRTELQHTGAFRRHRRRSGRDCGGVDRRPPRSRGGAGGEGRHRRRRQPLGLRAVEGAHRHGSARLGRDGPRASAFRRCRPSVDLASLATRVREVERRLAASTTEPAPEPGCADRLRSARLVGLDEWPRPGCPSRRSPGAGRQRRAARREPSRRPMSRESIVKADAVLVATGSSPRVPDWVTTDGERILTDPRRPTRHR